MATLRLHRACCCLRDPGARLWFLATMKWFLVMLLAAVIEANLLIFVVLPFRSVFAQISKDFFAGISSQDFNTGMIITIVLSSLISLAMSYGALSGVGRKRGRQRLP